MRASEAVKIYGTATRAAEALGVARSTLRDRLAKEKREPGALRHPVLPDVRESTDKLIARRTEHHARLKRYAQASSWQVVTIEDRKPIALALMGDPHIDDDGCAWDELQADVALIASTPGMYGLNIGDTTNNWVGRLARLFGAQETSQTSARQLAEWLLIDSGIRWAAVILGNHDLWNDGAEIIRRMVQSADVLIPVHDWAAKIELSFPNGATCRVSAAHDFKGRSIYNAAHGLKREAIWNQDGAHLIVAGHIHYGEIGQCELPGGHNPWLVRCRGYKDFDAHALVNGFHQGRRFRCPIAIIDPNAEPHNRVMLFPDVATGAKVLAAMRAAAPAAPRRKAHGAKAIKRRQVKKRKGSK